MRSRGFNVLELLIVLSIIGILLAYAIPSYMDQLTDTRRLMAETALMSMAGHMEAYFAEHNSYQGANFESLGLPEQVGENHYRLMIQEANDKAFKLVALPQAAQARHDQRCGRLILDSKGEKRISGYGRLKECW